MQRYDSYKDSGVKWLGEIPGHWEAVPLKKCFCESETGLWGEDPLNDDSDSICIRVADFDYKKGIISSKELTPRHYSFLPIKKKLQKGDLLLEKSGGGDIYPVGRVVRFNLEGINATCSNFIQKLRTCQSINSNYLFYLFFSMYSKKVNGLYYNQTTGIQNLKIKEFLSQVIFLPNKKEQETIANYLDSATSKIDEAIAQQQKMIDLLNERKQIIINNAVTKGLDPNVKMKPSGIDWIGDIPVHWEVKKIKYIANVKGRIGFKGYSASDLVEEGAYSLGGKHITNNIVDLTEPTFLSWKKYYESPEIMIKKGDIVTAQRGSLGHTAIIEEDIGPATINPSLVLITNIKCYNKYLYWYLLSYPILKTIEVLNTATAVPMLSQKQIENMTIAMPSYKEQELISAYLEKETKKIEVSKDNINKQISLLQERKQIIINDVVTGKVKVI